MFLVFILFFGVDVNFGVEVGGCFAERLLPLVSAEPTVLLQLNLSHSAPFWSQVLTSAAPCWSAAPWAPPSHMTRALATWPAVLLATLFPCLPAALSTHLLLVLSWCSVVTHSICLLALFLSPFPLQRASAQICSTELLLQLCQCSCSLSWRFIHHCAI